MKITQILICCDDVVDAWVEDIRDSNFYNKDGEKLGLLDIESVHGEALIIAVINNHGEYLTYNELISLVDTGDKVDILGGELKKIKRIIYDKVVEELAEEL